jgi:hypothetical protein
VIRIEGTNFDVPPAPPASGYVGGDSPVTVEVEVDGRAADEVKVWHSGLITCLVPPYRGDPAVLTASPGLDVDVLIRNVGPPIDEDTFVDAFTFQRADLTRDTGILVHVVKTLILELRRQVIQNIAVSTRIDYDAATGDSLDIVEIASVPGIALLGPDIQEDKFRRTSEKPNTQDVPTLTYTKKRIERTSRIAWDVTILGRGLTQALNLVSEFTEYFRRHPRLVVDRDSTDPAAGTVEYDLFLTSGPTRTGSANEDDVYGYAAGFEIRGVPIDADAGTQIEWGTMLDDPADVDFTYEEE